MVSFNGRVSTRVFAASGTTGPGSGSFSVPTRFDRFDSIHTTLQDWVQKPEDGVGDLRTVMEHNDYHHSSVWSHTLEVVKAGRELIDGGISAIPQIEERLEDYLDHVIDPSSEHQYTRAEILFVAMHLHDIGKGMQKKIKKGPQKGDMVDILGYKEDGVTTTALGHAKYGAGKAEEVAQRELGMSVVEASYLRDIVDLHMRCFSIQSSLEQGPGKRSGDEATFRHKIITDALSDMKYDAGLILHTIADLQGSDSDTSEGEIFMQALISELFAVPRERISTTSESLIDDVEAIAKKHGTILLAGSEEDNAAFMTKLKQACIDDYVSRAAAGTFSPKADPVKAGEKRFAKLAEKIKFNPGLRSADQVEEGFDFTSQKALSGRPVIFILS